MGNEHFSDRWNFWNSIFLRAGKQSLCMFQYLFAPHPSEDIELSHGSQIHKSTQSFPLIERTIYEHVFSCTDGEMGCQPALPVWKRGLNRRSYTEGEAKYLSDSAEVLSAPHRRVRQLNFNTLNHFDKHTSFNTQGKWIMFGQASLSHALVYSLNYSRLR